MLHSFRVATHLCTHTEAQLLHVCLHKMYLQVCFKQKVLRVLAELNEIEITRITTCHFHSSLNQAVPYNNNTLYQY